jgi:hypothetical protein
MEKWKIVAAGTEGQTRLDERENKNSVYLLIYYHNIHITVTHKRKQN